MFNDSDEVDAFQASLSVDRARFGDHEIELQTEALDALVAAASEMSHRGGSITARAADSGSRSYDDTERLWSRNVTRGLQHWESVGRMSAETTQSILKLCAAAQVSAILNLEDAEQLFFGTFFDKSILYSVAAPGASQHLSKLAFDVAEFEKEEVKRVLASHGWHRTVASDLPHFTYLGRDQEALRGTGLECVQRVSGTRVYDFWIPDLTLLQTILRGGNAH
jgi:LAS superfamily LD-carboxypeptidase LdcB